MNREVIKVHMDIVEDTREDHRGIFLSQLQELLDEANTLMASCQSATLPSLEGVEYLLLDLHKTHADFEAASCAWRVLKGIYDLAEEGHIK